jgi:hypothetical protein
MQGHADDGRSTACGAAFHAKMPVRPRRLWHNTRPLPVMHEFPRVPGQGTVCRGTAFRCRPARLRAAERGGRRGQGHRRRFLGGEGPDPRRWPRQGRRREAAQDARRRCAKPRPRACSARAWKPTSPAAAPCRWIACWSQATDIEQGAVPVGAGRPRHQAASPSSPRPKAAWTSRRRARQPGRDPDPQRELRAGPAALPVPQDGLRARPQGQAGRPAHQDHDGPVQAVQREGPGAGRTEPAAIVTTAT